jgi:beta-lactamase regulating signal transducer with metallopeptidase domain
MENYLYINAVISFAVLAFIHFEKGTSTANYYLSSLAIIAWFIPYPLLAELIPKEALTEPIILAFSKISAADSFSGEPILHLDVDLWLKWSLVTLLNIGFFLFMKRLITSVKWRNQLMKDPSLTLLKQSSATHKLSVYSVSQISSALLLGIMNPIIIISNKITDPKHIALIISHEKQHLRSLDNVRLLLLALAECLFWWNPLVRKLIKMNRFFIEARCDENASKLYGTNAYIEDLASLVLAKHHDKHQEKPNRFVCSASANITNNIARIKLLKEKRKMTFRKKLAYTVIALTTITTMSWNTLATATTTVTKQQNEANQKKLGALIKFDTIITNKLEGDKQDTYRYQVTFWVNFDEKATFKIGEKGFPESFTINFTAKDLGESTSLQYELIETHALDEKTISKPRLTVAFGQEATIEIDNPQVSKYAYLIKATPTKSTNPSVQ